MKQAAFLVLVLFVPLVSSVAQQKETFDLATFTVPDGWKKVSATADVISYAITNNQEGTYCQIGIYRSTSSNGGVRSDFQRDWQDLIVKTYRPSAPAALVPAASRNGWDAQGGAAPFEFGGGQSIAMLVTMSGYAKSMSIVVLTNTDGYQPIIESFLGSVELGTPAGAGGAAASPAQTAVQPGGAAPSSRNVFAFTRTTFDDGWIATVGEDWVEVANGGTRVLIHYPNRQADHYNSVVKDGLQNRVERTGGSPIPQHPQPSTQAHNGLADHRVCRGRRRGGRHGHSGPCRAVQVRLLQRQRQVHGVHHAGQERL